ncbi:MAG: isoaspartyl peptidase/L-asparaginase family protein [Planctomycetaceae bacterium]
MSLLLTASGLRANDRLVDGVVLAVHGGLGESPGVLTADEERAVRAGLEKALKAGHRLLQEQRATSLEAVEAAIRVLEDDPLFNAGRGAVFTSDGRNELDASIMDGRNRKAGAVAGVTIVKNPISAARAVMERTPHVLLVSKGAEEFAKQVQLELVDPSYFKTEKRWRELEERRKKEQAQPPGQSNLGFPLELDQPRRHWSTVGAVARDAQGHLAAGTSTGGMSYKRYGRVGDSPIIGAGTFADDSTCAVSCTGHGEFFIRWQVASDISAQIEYRQVDARQAVDRVINGKLKPAGGEGGAIVLDRHGHYSSATNSDSLWRGWIRANGELQVELYPAQP